MKVLDPEIRPAFGSKLTFSEPEDGGLQRASVSVIFEVERTPRLLLIRRAEREGDPWSGQVAFPGGKVRPEEGSLRETAIRETVEEVGIDLAGSAEFLGYFGPFVTHTGVIAVTPAVFKLRKEVKVTPNAEVESHRWVELGSLLSPEARSTYKVPLGGRERELPALRVQDYVVWGLTYRMISSLFWPEP